MLFRSFGSFLYISSKNFDWYNTPRFNSDIGQLVKMFENVWLLGLGLVAGIVGSIVGLGGGIVTVPVLTFIGVPHTLASSSSLFAAFSNSIASTASYARQKRVDYKNGLRLGLMSVPGTILGAILSGSATSEMFKILFAVVLGGSC